MKRLTLWLIVPLLVWTAACNPAAEPPPYVEVLEVHGTPYERGFQHGQHFRSKIHSLYTMLLTSSIFPYLNRERPDVASVLLRYKDKMYDDGQFSYLIMLESARNLEKTLPPEYIEEMQGVADGSGMPYEQILVLNTFVDTLLGFRSITFFIKIIQGPSMLSVDFGAELARDGVDNDGDGDTDEGDEGLLDPYEPSPYAAMVEVPTDASIHFVFNDSLEGVNPESIRFQVNDRLFVYGDPGLEVRAVSDDGKTQEAILTPPGGFEPGQAYSVIVQCGDLDVIVDPPPEHARYMRDERITFTTVGYRREPQDVVNEGYPDGRTQPPSIGFAVRGAATSDGNPLLAHHFALLDSNVTHKHTALFIHRPSNGKPFAYVGWAGVIWGFSGMNTDGFAYLVNMSDTLNSPYAQAFNQGLIFAQLVASGIPVGIMGREMLEHSASTASAVAYLRNNPSTFGWNFLLLDRKGTMIAAELDANIQEEQNGGCHTYSSDPDDPESLDAWGRPLASVGEDDLRVASHYVKNLNEIDYSIVGFDIRPQRFWSSFYFRSLRAFFVLGDEIEDRYGCFDLDEAIDLLRTPALVDQRDSMNAVVYEPAKLRLHYAMGQVPATDGSFATFDLSRFADGGE